MNIRHLFLRGSAIAALALSLSACKNMAQANMDQIISPGASYAQIEARYGKPDLVCPLAGGGQRAIWTSQPKGHYAWAANVGADGRIDRMQALLTDRHFGKLVMGWTPEQVRCEFGPPAYIDGVGLPGYTTVVWSYRYLQDGVWNSLMYVYMGPKGDHVTGYNPGPDPAYELKD